jgi:hypothetical protein
LTARARLAWRAAGASKSTGDGGVGQGQAVGADEGASAASSPVVVTGPRWSVDASTRRNRSGRTVGGGGWVVGSGGGGAREGI